jgi:cytochrome oxidase Cu insertion factor (SCO1/SenC/PrrC family)
VPGMNSGLNISDPVVVAAFRAALEHQGLIVLVIFGVLVLGWLTVRTWLTPGRQAAAVVQPEPAWRQLLRIGFGLLWVFDGILQAQPKMAVGLPSQVIEPAAVSSPRWVQHVVNAGGTTWSYHPLQAGASAVWIQVGIGLWLIVAARGPLSRLAGLASAGWGLVVWIFGEAFGQIFAPGLTWMFGAPGAALIYAVAGVLIALPDRVWSGKLTAQLMAAGTGLFLAGMAVLQAWPGRGYWQGTSGTLAGMTQSMAQTPQPGFLSGWITGFTAFDQANGFAVNLFVVIVLAGTGIAFLTLRPRLIRPALAAFTVLCLADWVLVEDLGFLGGLGTDPNSMVPWILFAAAGYLAVARGPVPVTDPAPGPWLARLRTAVSPPAIASARARSVVSAGAFGIIILGVVPMAAAQASPAADPILARAIGGAAGVFNEPAPPFSLADQHGRPVTPATLHGKVVLLTFLDPVCVNDCPLEAQELKQAGQLLGADATRVELVAIVANPVDYQIGYTQAFDRQESLDSVPDWLYLTGTLAQLRQAWQGFGVSADIEPGGAMIGHSEIAFVLDQRGNLRQEMDFSPGPGTAATQSSFAAELAGAARQLLGQS